ncbi:hypothetical protein GLF_2207 [Gluconobacter frateurii NBRC 101659]|nr:hypothetical protein GLF_2207 [Gluconobacter frateurii NBRC 101659]
MNKSLQTAIVLIAFVISFPFLLSILPHIGPVVSRETPTDGWNKFFEEWLRAIGPLGSVIIGWMMWRIAKTQQQISTRQLELTSSQHALARSQFDLAKQQANISFEQKEIAKNKFLLDKHNKQYESIKSFCDSYEDITLSFIFCTYRELHTKYMELNRNIISIKILHNYDLYRDASKVQSDLLSVISKKCDLESGDIDDEEYQEKIRHYIENDRIFYLSTFLDKVKQLLDDSFNPSDTINVTS